VWQDQLKDLDARLWPLHGRHGFQHGNDLQGHVEAAGLLRTLRIATAALLFELILSDQDKAVLCDVAGQTHAAYCDAVLQRLRLPLKLLRERIDREAMDSLDQSGRNGHWHLAEQARLAEARQALDPKARDIESLIRLHASLFDPDSLVRDRQVPGGAWATVLTLHRPRSPLPALEGHVSRPA